jgi:DNA-binding CsgD family transcriptional regulator
MHPCAKHLTKKDCIYVLELINSSISCEAEQDFLKLINGMKYLIPFDYAICGISKLASNGSISSFEILNINYPCDWLEVYVKQRYDKIDPIVTENYTNYKLQYWADTYRKYQTPPDFISTAKDFKLKDGYTLGFKDWKANTKIGSIFSIAGQAMDRSPRTELILNTVIPHFHQTLIRLTSNQGKSKTESLTLREMEVLNWLKYGKTSWDISRILKISERTVNFHCSSVMQKFDAVSRSHALAIAINNGVISLD